MKYILFKYGTRVPVAIAEAETTERVRAFVASDHQFSSVFTEATQVEDREWLAESFRRSYEAKGDEADLARRKSEYAAGECPFYSLPSLDLRDLVEGPGGPGPSSRQRSSGVDGSPVTGMNAATRLGSAASDPTPGRRLRIDEGGGR